MNWKTKAIGLSAALLMGLGAAGPAVAQNDLPVSVTVVQEAPASFTFALASGSDADFGNVNLNADESATSGVVAASDVTFDVAITGDDDLYRGGGDITVTLGNGSAADAALVLTTPAESGANVSGVSYQIPGRYLSVSALQNPQQAKFTNLGGTSTAPIWDGTGSPTSAQRPPRAAGSETIGAPIYKVGDIGGAFGVGESGSSSCHVTSYSVLVDWPTACPDPTFGETGYSGKIIDYILPGSGFVQATQTIQLSLNVPAGVFPGEYTGQLTLTSTVS